VVYGKCTHFCRSDMSPAPGARARQGRAVQETAVDTWRTGHRSSDTSSWHCAAMAAMPASPISRQLSRPSMYRCGQWRARAATHSSVMASTPDRSRACSWAPRTVAIAATAPGVRALAWQMGREGRRRGSDRVVSQASLALRHYVQSACAYDALLEQQSLAAKELRREGTGKGEGREGDGREIAQTWARLTEMSLGQSDTMTAMSGSFGKQRSSDTDCMSNKQH